MKSTTINSPRVLIISHNPFSDVQNNGKTLTSFFTGWPSTQIAQFYLSNEVPSFSVCNKFYRVTDFEILKAFLKGHNSRGNVVEENTINQFTKNRDHLLSNRIYGWVRDIFQSRSAIAYSIRSLMWARRRWYSANLEKWLDDFRPDIVFFQASNCAFAYDIVEYICDRYHIPLIIQVTDDYVTPCFSLNPFYWLEMIRLQWCFRKAVNRAVNIVAIGDDMAEEYHQRFGGQYLVAMNSVAIDTVSPTEQLEETKFGKTLVYAGNLGLNRWKVLLDIGDALDRLNRKQATKSYLDIYSLVNPKPEVLRQFASRGALRFKGSLNVEQMARVTDSAYAMLHVESFDKKNIPITRLSISTKIPECMVAGKILIAVGSEKVASIRYVKQNQIGYVIEDLHPMNLERELLKVLEYSNEHERRIQNALKLVAERHDVIKTRVMVRTIIQGAIDAQK